MNNTKNIKVCHITTVHPAKDVRILIKECASLSKAGFDVTLIVVGEESEFIFEGVKVIGLGKRYRTRLSRLIHAPGLAYREAIKIKAEIYHFHDPEFLRYAKKLARKKNIVIYDVHEDLPRQIMAKYYIPKPLRKLLAKIVARYENYSALKMSGIITATKHIAQRFEKARNVEIIHNFPILDQQSTPVLFSQKENEICYIGAIATVRGIKEVIDALPATDVRLNLGGTFNERGLRESLMQERGWERVNELGYVDRQKAAAILKRSKAGLVVLHPTENYKEALPVKLFEYMAAGIPVIASDFPVWRSIIDMAGCGICVDPLDSDAIAKAINLLLSDEKKAEKMGMDGYTAVNKYYRWENEEKKLLLLYDKLLYCKYI